MFSAFELQSLILAGASVTLCRARTCKSLESISPRPSALNQSPHPCSTGHKISSPISETTLSNIHFRTIKHSLFLDVISASLLAPTAFNQFSIRKDLKNFVQCVTRNRKLVNNNLSLNTWRSCNEIQHSILFLV